VRYSKSLVAVIFFFLSLNASLSLAGWEIFTIQNLDHFTYWFPIHTLDIDKQGHLHLAYGKDNLHYLHSLNGQTGSAWLLEILENTSEVKGFAALALDTLDRPHICYHADGCLTYAHFNGEKWIVKIIDDSKYVGTSISMALDLKGGVHISYYDCFMGNLNYALYDVGIVSSLALDSQGRVHIAYFDWFNRDLKYACRNGAGWTKESLDCDGDVGDWPSLSIDQNECPHISYCDWTNRSLKYACWRFYGNCLR